MRHLSRADWGHPSPDSPGGYSIGQVGQVIVHHSYRPHVPEGTPQEAVADAVHGIFDYHANTKGWADIGYQWCADQDGRIYEGRGWFRTGAHTEGRNSKSVGLCFLIDGDQTVPTDAAWQAARTVAAEGVRVGALAQGWTVAGHTDFAAKSCPGRRTYSLLDRIFEEDPFMALSDKEQKTLCEDVVKIKVALGDLVPRIERTEDKVVKTNAAVGRLEAFVQDLADGTDIETAAQRLLDKARG